MESLQRLRVLREVARHGSFTAAGQALHLSQPAVSQHISALERELGARLVDRSTSGARLTLAGEVALRHGLRMLSTADAARREIGALDDGTSAPIRIAAFSTACTFLLPGTTMALRRRNPGIELELVDCDSEDALELVRPAEADLAVVFDYALHPLVFDGLVARHLVDDPVSLVMPVGHPAARRDVVDIEVLADQPWISGTGFACRESLNVVCGAAGFAPRVALDSNRYPTTLALVAADHGVALVPRSALIDPPPGVAVRSLRPAPPARRLWAVTSSEPEGLLAELAEELAHRCTPPATVRPNRPSPVR